MRKQLSLKVFLRKEGIINNNREASRFLPLNVISFLFTYKLLFHFYRMSGYVNN